MRYLLSPCQLLPAMLLGVGLLAVPSEVSADMTATSTSCVLVVDAGYAPQEAPGVDNDCALLVLAAAGAVAGCVSATVTATTATAAAGAATAGIGAAIVASFAINAAAAACAVAAATVAMAGDCMANSDGGLPIDLQRRLDGALERLDDAKADAAELGIILIK